MGKDKEDRDVLEELEAYLAGNAIEKQEACIVGGYVLSWHGLRQHQDIDVVLDTKHRRRILEGKSATRITSELEIVGEGWAEALGISDSELIHNEDLHLVTPEGFKLVSLEVLFAKYLYSARPKHQSDRILLERYALETPGWRWDLIPVSRADLKSERGTLARLRTIATLGARLAVKALRGSRHPLKGVRKARVLLLSRMPIKRMTILRPQGLRRSSMDIGTLLQLQFLDGQFGRYDTLLRLRTVEGYLSGREQNRCLIEYERMQRLRVDRLTRLQFEELIHSVQRKGYAEDRHPITLDRDGTLKDGSHRLALALASRVEDVPVSFVRGSGPKNYGRHWFEQRDFDPETLKELDGLLLRELIRTGAAFQLVLWPPAQHLTAEIEKDLSAEYRVIAKRLSVAVSDLPSFVREIYRPDDIERWKVEKKLFHMRTHAPVVSAFSFIIPEPRYRTKSSSRSYLSTEVERLKAQLRAKYRDSIEGYVYDIILHIGDNPLHNRAMLKAMHDHGVMIGADLKGMTASND